jgi:hypothetical protein
MPSRQSSYALLTDALRLLPVHPSNERSVLGLARFHAAHAGSSEVRGQSLSLDELNELFIEDVPGPRISHKGARLLLKLFYEGALEVLAENEDEIHIEVLEAYAAARASIVGSYHFRRRGEARPFGATALQFAPPRTSHFPLDSARYRVITHRISG